MAEWHSQDPVPGSLAPEPLLEVSALGLRVLRHSVTTSHVWLLSMEDRARVTEEPNFRLN